MLSRPTYPAGSAPKGGITGSACITQGREHSDLLTTKWQEIRDGTASTKATRAWATEHRVDGVRFRLRRHLVERAREPYTPQEPTTVGGRRRQFAPLLIPGAFKEALVAPIE